MDQQLEDMVALAAHENNERANANLFALLATKTVFYEANFDEEAGQEGQQPTSLPLTCFEDGNCAFVVYTAQDDARLPDSFGGAEWLDALRILLSQPNASGMIITNRGGNSVGLSKDRAATVLRDLERQGGASNANAGAELETLIQQASQDDTDENYNSVLHALRDTELFSPVANDAQGGRLALNSFSVGPLQHALRLFTSSKHPRLAKPFAGMRWETIIQMLRDTPELDGIQLVSKTDTWIVFDKTSALKQFARESTA